MLVAKITHAFFCKPFFRLLSKRYQVADPKCILFDSVPDFADNARALYDHMIKDGMNQRYQIFWLVADPDKYQKAAPVNVHFVKRQGKWSERYTLAAHKATWQAGTIFFTHSMYQQMHRPAGQKRINLWHGCGYKAAKGGSQNISFDKLLVPSQLFVETKSTFFGRAAEDFLPIGYPRYDEIVQKNETARAGTSPTHRKNI